MAWTPVDHVRNGTVGASPLSPHPAEMREPAANTAQMLLSHIYTCSREKGGQVFVRERRTETPSVPLQKDENRPVNGYDLQ